MIEQIVFVLATAGLLVSGGAVVMARSPLRAALYLISGLCCSAVLYVMLHAPFVATMQVLVYAGAIMVLFVFVIMLLNLGDDADRPAYLSISKFLGTLAVLFLVWRIALGVLGASGGDTGAPVDGSVKSIGTLLLTDYLFGFEAISVLLLVAVVGAVVLGLKRLT